MSATGRRSITLTSVEQKSLTLQERREIGSAIRTPLFINLKVLCLD